MATKKKATKGKSAAKSTTKTAAKKTTATATKKGDLDKVSKTRTKSQILATLSGQTGLSKKDVSGIIETLGELIALDLSKGPGSFTVPGLMKITVVRKPATKARKGTNPFTGEEMTFKAKPARNVVRIRPLKGLKDRV